MPDTTTGRVRAPGVTAPRGRRILDEPMDDEITPPEVYFNRRRFLQAGAVTSTDAMVRRLGARRWKRLHRLVYAIVALGIVHFWLLVKADTSRPQLFAIIAGVLVATRFLPERRRPRVVLTIDGRRVNRSYTIASPPTRPGAVEITVKRKRDGYASHHVHDTFVPGARVQVGAPAGRFLFTGDEARRVLLLA